MLQPVFTTSFQKDVKRVEKRGYDMEKLKEVIKLILLNQRPLPPERMVFVFSQGEIAAEMGAAH